MVPIYRYGRTARTFLDRAEDIEIIITISYAAYGKQDLSFGKEVFFEVKDAEEMNFGNISRSADKKPSKS